MAEHLNAWLQADNLKIYPVLQSEGCQPGRLSTSIYLPVTFHTWTCHVQKAVVHMFYRTETVFPVSCRIGVFNYFICHSRCLLSRSLISLDCISLWFFASLQSLRSSLSSARFLMFTAPTWSASSS